MNTCIFCHKDSSLSTSVEHIIPESLGNKHHIIPRGYVCDECNNYFGKKIEQVLLSQPYFISLRFRNEIRNKKDKLVKDKIYIPEINKYIECTFETKEDKIAISFDDKEIFEQIKNGNIKSFVNLKISGPEYPSSIMSRFLAKCAYEFFLYNMGEENYDDCVTDLLGKENDILKNLREYARYGNSNKKIWQYYQRRIQSEGTIRHNRFSGRYQEIIHKMMLFCREYEKISEEDIKAEIYFIMEIAGIEYAICISDPNITGYIEWLKENGGVSPLNEKDDNILPYSLSDMNPFLISKKGN